MISQKRGNRISSCIGRANLCNLSIHAAIATYVCLRTRVALAAENMLEPPAVTPTDIDGDVAGSAPAPVVANA